MMHEEKIKKNFPFRFKEEKKINKKKICKEEFVSDHNSPILTKNVS